MKHTLTALLLLLSIVSFSQRNFIKGYVVLNNKDSVKGFIDDKDWKKNPSEILFSAQPDDQNNVTYTPGKLLFFGMDRGYYRSAVVTINKVYPNKHQLTTKVEEDTLFLETLVTGELGLYRYVDEFEKLHFYVDQQGKLTELVVKYTNSEIKETSVSVTASTTKNAVGKLNLFIGQLNILTSNCPSLQSELNSLEYETKDLTKFVTSYNKLCGQQKGNAYTQTKEKTITKLNLVGGLSYTDHTFSSPNRSSDAGFPSTISPVGGLSIQFILPKHNRHWSIYAEAIYKGYHETSSSSGVEMNLNYVRLNTFLRFTSTLTKVKPFVQAGMSNSLAINSNVDGYTYTMGTVLVDGFREYEQGLLFGVGAELSNRIGMEARVEKSNGFSSFTNRQVSVFSGYMILSYRLF